MRPTPEQTDRSPRARRSAAIAAGVVAVATAGAVGATLFQPTVPPVRAENLSAQLPRVQAPGFADIVERVSPAVVSIRTKREPRRLSSFDGGDTSPFERFFREFEEQFGERGATPRGRGEQRERRRFSQGQGSGFIISEDGYVVTNNHVIDGAEDVEVVLDDGEVLDAEVIGVDPKTDLALVKIEDERSFPFVTFNRDDVRVGDWVVAVGNPFGLGGTVTAGIVSARGREIGAGPYDDFIQIDAPINRGNSGGPTFDLEGEVVGVNTAIYSPSGGSVGIGFAIPASIAERVIEDLKDDGRVTRGWLGVQIQPVTEDIADSIGLAEAGGALVADPQEDSPAEAAGIKAGDAILAVNGEEVEGPRDLARVISGFEPGTTVDLTIFRDGSERTIEVTLGRLSEDTVAAADAPAAKTGALDPFGLTVAPAADLDLETDGLAIVELDPSGVAAEKGLAVGDVIVAAGGEDVRDVADLEARMEAARSEGRRNVLLKIQSGEDVRFVALPVEQG